MMDTTSLIFLLLRCGLGAMFAAAATAKARDLAATRASAVALGVPERVAPAAALALVATEAAVAVSLVITPFAPFGAAAAVALLGTFSVVVAANLRAGRRPPCNCFGQRSSSPIGRATLIRNGVLAVVAGTLLVRRVEVGAESLGSFQRFTTIQAVATVLGITVTAVFAFHSWLLVNLVLQNGRLLGRIEQLEFAASPEPVGTNTPVARAPTDQRHARRGPAIGSPAPRFGLNDVDGRTVTIDDLLADGRPPVLLFLEPRCSACVEMAVEIRPRNNGTRPQPHRARQR